jgi:hypothetical protein
MRAYSIDLRERALAACDAGVGTRAVAAGYAVRLCLMDRVAPFAPLTFHEEA